MNHLFVQFRSRSFLSVLPFLLFVSAFGQDCSIGPDNRPSSPTDARGSHTIHTGDRTPFQVVNGAKYRFNSCASGYNDRITAHREVFTDNYQRLFSQDSDNYCTDGEQVEWTSNFTGTLWITITDYNCNYVSSSAMLSIEQLNNIKISDLSDQRAGCTESVTFNVTAQIEGVAAPTFSYQWQENIGSGWTDIAGATTQTLVINNIQAVQFGNQYRAQVSFGLLTNYSSAATLHENATDPPSGIEASSNDCSAKINLSWQWYAKNPSKFQVEYSSNQQDWYTLGEPSGSLRKYSHSNVARGQVYYYRMRTFSDACAAYTSASAPIEGISPLDPTPPDNIITSSKDIAGGKGIEIQWRDRSNNEEGFIIKKLSDSYAADDWKVYSSDAEKSGMGTMRYLDEDVVNCEPYTYRIYSYNVCRPSGVRVTSESSEHTLSVPITKTVLRDSLDASKGYYPDKVHFSWKFNPKSNHKYVHRFAIYERELGTSTTPQLVQTLERTKFSWERTGNDAGKLYEYFIVAEGDCGPNTIKSYDIHQVGTLSNLPDDLPSEGVGYSVGFRSPAGLLNGNVSYSGGIAVPNVKVVVERESGQVGHSLYFDGLDDHVHLPANERLAQLEDEFSLSLWLRPEVILSRQQFLFLKERSFLLSTKGDSVFLYTDNGTMAWDELHTDAVLQAGEYTHIIATYKAGAVKLYVNGRLNSEKVHSGGLSKRISDMYFGGYPYLNTGFYYQGWLDEMRLYNRALDEDRILKDYGRYVPSAEPNLLAYWRLDEGKGPFIFDLARFDGIYQQNDGRLRGASWSTNIPDGRQLGMAGYTDGNGNYTVSGILYKGVGESFTITPSITLAGAVHAFTPTQRVEFVGEGNTIVNKMDFTDISSFEVTGKVLFDHNGVRSGSEGVSFYIDGTQPVVNSTGQLVLSDNEGRFKIQVPIGLHRLVARKGFHSFAHDGSWPYNTAKYDFQDKVSGIEFIDQTRRTLIGRVVGGLLEDRKPLGFHKSTNNIGQARFVLQSQDKLVSDTITTSANSGEYIVSLPPKLYTVYKADTYDALGINVKNNPSAELYFRNLDNVDLRLVPHEQHLVDTVYASDRRTVLRVDTVSYHANQNFVYRSIPEISVTSGMRGEEGQPFKGESHFIYTTNQGRKDTIDLNYGSVGGVLYPVMHKNSPYAMRISVRERYVNRADVSNPVNSYAPVSDAELRVANNIGKGYYRDATGATRYYAEGQTGNTADVFKLTDTDGDTLYSFFVGDPDLNLLTTEEEKSFSKTMQITALVGNHVVYWPGPNVSNVFRGYVFGSRPTGTSFVTEAPDMVDFILRDPPGSESSAFLASEEEVSHTHSFNIATSLGVEAEIAIGAGTTTFTGGGVGVITGVINEASAKAKLGFEFSTSLGYEGEWVETYSTAQEIGTSDDPDVVGADGDIYVGKSQNYRFGLAQNLYLVPQDQCSKPEVGCPLQGNISALRSRSGVDYQVGSKIGFFLTPTGSPTFFMYTQSHIENILIPRIESLRNTLLLSNSKYVSKVPGDHDMYGANNDDPDWADYGKTPTSEYPDTDPQLDFSGPSYTFTPANDDDADSIRWYNQQVRLWKQYMADNEKEKLDARNAGTGENKSISAQVSYSSESTTSKESSNSVVFELSTGLSLGSQAEFSLFGVESEIEFSAALEVETGYSYTRGSAKATTYGYELSDPDEGDFLSIDVHEGSNNNGPIFILKDGGETSCPHEEGLETKYHRPGTQVGTRTLQRDKPRLAVDVPVVYNVPEGSPAVYKLTLYNDSESKSDRDYALKVLDESNPHGAILRVDGVEVSSNRTFSVPADGAIQKTLTLEKGPFQYDYDDIKIILHAECDEDIASEITLSAHFLPVCTDVSLLAPKDPWTLNTTFNDTLDISIGQFDINYAGLKRIDLKYKPSTASNWITLERFYRDTTGMNNPDLSQIPHNKPLITYAWALDKLPDGAYDLIAQSRCEVPKVGTVVVEDSKVHSGLVDRVSPHAFGAPQPSDGVLSPGEEIMIQFNEPIHDGLLRAENFSIRGELNGGNIRHPVSVYFDGAEDNYMRIKDGFDLTRKSFSIDMYARRRALGESILFSQGLNQAHSLRIGFDANDQLYFEMEGRRLTSSQTIKDFNWHHIAVTYDIDKQISSLSIDALAAGVSNNFIVDYQSRGDIYVGKSTYGSALPFKGNIHELRLWNRALSSADVSIVAVKRLNRSEKGLLANWVMEEGYGAIAQDYVRSRHAELFAGWQIEPSGASLMLKEASAYYKMPNKSFGAREDFTIEMWFKTAEEKEMYMFSNGTGDSRDVNTGGWAFGIEADGDVFVRHQNNLLTSSGTKYNDNVWHHMALVVYRVGNVLLYVDGKQVDAESSTSFSSFSGPALWIGALGWYEGSMEKRAHYFEGALDELRLWQTARRHEQIKHMRFHKLDGQEVGLRNYYPFEKYREDGGVLRVDVEWHDITGTGGVLDKATAPPVQLPRPVQDVTFNYSANQDKIILSPTTDPVLLENVSLDITVKDVVDKNGNQLPSPVTWMAYVDRNEVLWSDTGTQIEMKQGTSYRFDATIKNIGGQVQSFSLRNMPLWLTASPNQGTISPLSTRTIQFTINENVPIGTFVEDIYLRGNLGHNERFIIDLKVKKELPDDWKVQPEDYQYSMNIIGQVKMDGYLSRDSDDQLAAFIGDDCRGIVALRYVSTLDSYVAFLTVYHNEPSTSDLELRVWNASEGQVHTGLTPVLSFTSQALHGSITSPIVFEVPNFVRNQLSLSQGWQWVSFNLTSSALGNLNTLFKDYTNKTGDIIKGASYYEQYDKDKGWVGNIGHSGGVNVAKGYKLNVSRGGILPYQGAIPDPEATPIKLIRGWNWIGYTPQRPLPIAEALSRFNARTGDQVKGQYGFAVYGGTALGWIGSLQSMEPNRSYMVYSDTIATFTYPNYKPVYGSEQGRAVKGAQQLVSQQDLKKALNNISYPNNMTVVLEVSPLAVSASDYIEVHARGERRGTAAMREIEEGKWMAFVTVLGNSDGDKLSFVIHQPEKNKVYSLAAKDDLYFKSDAQLGSLASPLVLSPVEEEAGPDKAFFPYPNPLTDVVYFWVKDSELKIQNMVLRSLSGELLGRISSEDILRVGLHSYKTYIGRHLSEDSGLILLQLHTNKGIYTSSIIRSKN